MKYLIKKIITKFSSFFFEEIKRLEKEECDIRNDNLKKKMKSCGHGVGLWGNIKITGIRNVVLGNNVHISENAFIRGEGGLLIGDNTIISRNLVLYTMNHDYHGTRLPYDKGKIYKPVIIGKNVWIGMNVCITPGTIIHDGVIVGMGTVVSGEVPPMSIIGNEKWRILGYRDKAHYDELDKIGAFSGVNGNEYEPEI